MRVAVAFDHRGVKLRERLFEELDALGHETLDLGTDKPMPRIDYPDKAREVGEAIRSGEAERALLVCGSGVGASVAVNKIPGIRGAICHDVYSAHQGVEHDDMNVLCLGSEVSVAVEAAKRLDIPTRVVSMPCWELFEAQPSDYRDEVLPPDVKARISIEAGVALGWHKWVGDDGDSISIEHYGASAPGATVLEEFGFTADNVVARAVALRDRVS